MDEDDYYLSDTEYDPERPREQDTPEKQCIGEGCYRIKNHPAES